MIIDEGTFFMSLNLDKSTFAYDEIIPFQVNINCSKVNIKIKIITVSMIREIYLNLTKKKDEKEIISKVIKVEKGKEKYTIKDSINFL